MAFPINYKNKLKRRQMGALLGTGALLTLAGCGGGSSGGNNGGGNSGLPSATIVALTSNNRLVSFNSRTPVSANTVNITGVASGDVISSIDYRFFTLAPGTGADAGLYGIGVNGGSQQVYKIASNGAATAVGSRVVLTPPLGSLSIDFNPTVDRIRVVASSGNGSFRLNPNDGTLAATDTSLAYAVGDANFGQEPDVSGVAYTNVDNDSGTGTTLYGIDAARNTLVRIGGPNSTPSPNGGQLTTVANLSVDPTTATGFDIAISTTGFLSVGKRIYGIDIATGATIGGASVNVPSNGDVIDIAVVPSAV